MVCRNHVRSELSVQVLVLRRQNASSLWGESYTEQLLVLIVFHGM